MIQSEILEPIAANILARVVVGVFQIYMTTCLFFKVVGTYSITHCSRNAKHSRFEFVIYTSMSILIFIAFIEHCGKLVLLTAVNLDRIMHIGIWNRYFRSN